MKIPTFSASGKLLLFGEYLVLRGAKALAIPLRYGQTLQIQSAESENIIWRCFENRQEWLRIELTPDLKVIFASDQQKVETVRQLLSIIRKEKPGLKWRNLSFRFDLNFDRNFGFGTSSTLISLLGQWSGVNPFLLQETVFKGSGYDVAAATADGPIIYQRSLKNQSISPRIIPVKISESIQSNLLFIYTGKKQDSYREVVGFNRMKTNKGQIDKMTSITISAAGCESIADFESLMEESEGLLSEILHRTGIQKNIFSDYPFFIKSLGAWGGDFIMATFRDKLQATNYFRKKGMSTIFDYGELIKR